MTPGAPSAPGSDRAQEGVGESLRVSCGQRPDGDHGPEVEAPSGQGERIDLANARRREIYLYGDIEPRTDKGKVTFKVGSNAVTKVQAEGPADHVWRHDGGGSGLGPEDRAELRRQRQGHVHEPGRRRV